MKQQIAENCDSYAKVANTLSRFAATVSPPFSPRLHILSMPQRRLWNELTPLRSKFVLYGGTAVALHLGHGSVS